MRSSLKNALGKDDQEISVSITAYSKRNATNKSKSQSIWALDQQDDQPQNNPNNANNIKNSLESQLKSSFSKEKNLSEIVFYDIVENIQVIMGSDVNELDCLLTIEKSMKEILDVSKEDIKGFNVSFYQLLVKRIKKLKKKEKKQQLKEYDRIIHTNFKKKAPVQYINEDFDRQQYLQIKDGKMNKGLKGSGTFASNDGSSSKKSNSSNSNDGKLKGLLSLDKLGKDQGHNVSKNDKKNQSVMEGNESVSFSAVMSQSMAVKQRAPRQSKKQMLRKEEEAKSAALKKAKDEEDGENDDNDKDEAFIFYRPKKPKKGPSKI